MITAFPLTRGSFGLVSACITAAAVVVALAVPVDALCYQTGKAGMRLPDLNDTNGIPTCRAGYYCPGFDPANASTYPESCLAELDCAIERMQGRQCEDAQGDHEPIICPAGSYCPYNQGTIIKCESDVFCDLGSIEPRACPGLSLCDGTKARNYGSMIFFGVSTIVLIILFLLHRQFCLTSTLTTNANQSNTKGGASSSSSARVAVGGGGMEAPLLSNRMEGGGGGEEMLGRVSKKNNNPAPPQRYPSADSLDAFMTTTAAAPLVIPGQHPVSKNGGGSSELRVPRPSPTTNYGGAAAGFVGGRAGCDQELVEGFRRSRGTRSPFRLEFSNLAVSVEDSATGSTKHILKDMSGTMEPGTVTAIMGPSGAGKTTFMMALLGKKDPAWTTGGKLLVNGDDKLGELRHAIGFVPQDDVLHKELSVYKNLYYSSETRLPRDWTPKQKAAFRSSVIESLGLANHRDTVIGDEHERGVSGGQRKRASIGVELSAAPMAMFLDEPTSGLDSTTSLEVCSTLKNIAVETGLTVGMVIHQPRVEIWNGLDEVLFIGKGGRVVYQGAQASAQLFFQQKCRIEFPPDANPADVIIDAIDENTDALADLWKKHAPNTTTTGGPSAVTTVLASSSSASTSGSGFQGASFLRQFVLNHNRYIEKQLATMSVLRTELIVAVLCGLIMGTTFMDFSYKGFYVAPYRRVSPLPQTAQFPQMNMYTVMAIGMGAAPAGVRVFGLDRYSFYREAAAGHNRLAYFLGTLISVTYRCTYVSLLFASLYHFIGGLPLDFGPFFLALLLVYWNAYAVGMMVAQVASARMAPLVAQTIVICISMMNGFVDVPDFIKQSSFSFHCSQVIMQLWHDMYSHVFEAQFAEWGYTEGRTDSSLWLMFLLAVVVQLLAFGLMVGTNRDRQK